jgi:hypothetical protein
MLNSTAVALVMVTVCGQIAIGGAEREWQTGTWREVKIERPKVSFGVQSRDPNSRLPRTAPAREIRTYVIETNTLRLELRQDAVGDMPRIDALVGERVTFALEKKTIYIQDQNGREHRLTVRRQAPLSSAKPK